MTRYERLELKADKLKQQIFTYEQRALWAYGNRDYEYANMLGESISRLQRKLDIIEYKMQEIRGGL